MIKENLEELLAKIRSVWKNVNKISISTEKFLKHIKAIYKAPIVNLRLQLYFMSNLTTNF